MKKLFLLLLFVGVGLLCQADDLPFVKATDLYYGTAYTTQHNHQLWLTSADLEYDAVNSQLIGSDGNVMRLDLMCPSSTDIAGSYEIVGPNYADAPYKMNKKYTYWTYFVNGGFVEKKLTIGTCTITCTSRDTYTIVYNVQEIDGGPIHQGTITDIHITAVTEHGGSHQLVPSCTNSFESALSECTTAARARKYLENGHLVIEVDGKRYDTLGR